MLTSPLHHGPNETIFRSRDCNTISTINQAPKPPPHQNPQLPPKGDKRKKMCQTHLLTYTCTHTLPIRHSTCRGTFTTTPNPRKSPKPACSGAATLVLNATSACGDCQRRDAEAELEAVGTVVDGAGEGQWGWDLGREMFALGRRFPSCRRFRGGSSRKLEQRRRAEGASETGCGEAKKVERARGSLLRREVFPEEVVASNRDCKTLVGEGWDQGDWVSVCASFASSLPRDPVQTMIQVSSSAMYSVSATQKADRRIW